MSLLVKEMLTMGEKQLMDSDIADATRDCKILYCYMMDIPFSKIILEYQEVLQDRLCDKYFELIDRRSNGEPVQYIMGSQEFMGLEFIVNENVLIPRQDTETLVEDALEIINTGTLRGEDMDVKRKEWDILDLCTGSGAIGVSLARIANKVNVTCSDISEGAIKVAKENAQKHGVAKSVKDVVFFIIGSGIGGALVLNRKLHKGNSLFGGEFGRMLLRGNETLSMLASPVHSAKRYAESQSISSSFSGKDLFSLADQGVIAAQNAVSDLYDSLALGIYNVLVVLDPELVVLGGGLSKKEELLGEIDRRVRKLLKNNNVAELKFQLERCRYFNDANLLGAVARFQSQGVSNEAEKE